ncbi:3194_t:CDS:2 [Dentiscutata heterogama]|uniref:3194_t:CDS:1 n=1 Tax=Dentiscutata heterogama TaxID=1316150 RepID=A0ACA9LXA4_9GLOM|nr:3194_t:CDS:2 [Dentiscutata heterogama]
MNRMLKEKKLLISQMRSYRYHATPFNTLFDNNESFMICDDDNYEKKEPTSEEVKDVEFLEEESFKIEELLNLDVANFTNDLDKVILDIGFESSKEEDSNIQNYDAENDADKDNWDPEKEINMMLD